MDQNTQKPQTTNKKKSIKQIKAELALKQTKQFKEKYFDYYDDVKSNTHKVYDW